MMTRLPNSIPVSPGDSQASVRKYIQDLQKAPSRETMISGMVKPAEGADGLMFAHIGDCSHWVFISETVIQSVQNTGRVQCGGSTYSVAEIQLKAPQTELEKTFARVADLHRTKLAKLSSSNAIRSLPAITCPEGTQLTHDQWGNPLCT